jgi:hypothetical protein
MTGLRSQLFVVVVATLILTTTATSQVLIARANPAAAGQQAVFKVIGGASPVCLDLFQLADSGALLTMSSYYVGSLQTVQVTVPPVAHFKTTAAFALSDPTVNAPTGCNSLPTSFLTDPTRSAQIYETLTGGSSDSLITINQVADAMAIANARCNRNISGSVGNIVITQGNGAGDSATISNITDRNNDTSICADLSNTAKLKSNIVQDATAVVTFGFEEVDFQAVNTDPLTPALATCGSPTLSAAGAALIVTCALPAGGGTVATQTF